MNPVVTLVALEAVGAFLTEMDEHLREEARRGYEQFLLSQERSFRAQQASLDHERAVRLSHLEHGQALHRNAEDVRLRFDSERALMRERVNLELYPVPEGPGHLRASLALEHRDAAAMPPIVLLAPPLADVRQPQAWIGLRHRILEDLSAYQGPLLTVRMVDRSFQWPHAEFYEHDLRGLPVIIVQTVFADDRLGISLAGCHLSLGGTEVQGSRRVFSASFPSSRTWSQAALAQLNGNRTVQLSEDFTAPDGAEQLQALNHEFASRAVAVYVLAAVDCYHLQRSVGYDEQVDRAAANTPLVGDDWPVDLGMPIERVADPAYHLMHQAQRQLRRSSVDAAESALDAAFGVLAAQRGPAGDRDQLVRDAAVNGRLHDKHRLKAVDVIRSLPADAAWAAVDLQPLLDPPTPAEDGAAIERSTVDTPPGRASWDPMGNPFRP